MSEGKSLGTRWMGASPVGGRISKKGWCGENLHTKREELKKARVGRREGGSCLDRIQEKKRLYLAEFYQEKN